MGPPTNDYVRERREVAGTISSFPCPTEPVVGDGKMSIPCDTTLERVEGSFLGQPSENQSTRDDLFLAVRAIAENIGRALVATSFTYRLL
jgi:hypothetical protein